MTLARQKPLTSPRQALSHARPWGRHLDSSSKFVQGTATGNSPDDTRSQHPGQSGRDEVAISPTPWRVKKMRVQLQGILLDDALTPTEASALAGRCSSWPSLSSEKGGRASLKTLRKRSADGRFRSPQQGWALGPGLRSAILWVYSRLDEVRPRRIPFQVNEVTILWRTPTLRHSSTDGDSSCTRGVRRTKPQESCRTGSCDISAVGELSIIIIMLEIVAQIIPLLALAPVIAPHVILFVDNEPAKHALNTGYGKDQSLNLLCLASRVDRSGKQQVVSNLATRPHRVQHSRRRQSLRLRPR